MINSFTKPSAANLLPFVSAYLKARPCFYAFIRPQEAFLFKAHQRFIRPPVLDFGCGDGFFASLIFSPRSIAVGLDVESSRLQENPVKSPYQKLVTYDGLKIPFKPASFNTVISNCVFEHLPDLPTNLQEMYRILKPGGYLLTTVMGQAWDTNLLGSRLFGRSYTQAMRRQQVHLNLLSRSEWDKRFNKYGFIIKDTLGYLHLPACRLNELSHYLAIPSLISYRLTGHWVLWPSWYRLLSLDTLITHRIQPDIQPPNSQSAAYFYLLQKPL